VTDLAALLSSAASADSLLDQMLDAHEEKRPDVAEAIRLCAVPRRFDASILDLLRGKEEGSDELIERLRRLTFVTVRPNGDHVYQDSVRQLLLDRWRDKHPDVLLELHERLSAHYRDRHRGAERLETDLMYTRPLLYAADPTRCATVAAAIASRLVAPMVEALYHDTCRSFQAGYERFRGWFEYYEHEGRLSICQALLEAELQFLEAPPVTPGGGDGIARWMRYWNARLLRRQGRRSAAEKALRALLAECEGDVRLHAWVLSDLGAALEESYDVHGAKTAYLEEIAVSETSGEDRFNLPVPYCRLARLQWLLGDLDAARKHYAKAIAIADETANLRLAVSARLDLSGVQLDAGDLESGRDTGLEAFRRVRLEEPTNRPLALRVAERFLTVFARRSAPLLESVAHEGRALAEGSEDPAALREFRALHAEMQLAGGDAPGARDTFAELSRDSAEAANAETRADLALQAAAVAEDLGDLDEALAIYTRLIETADGGPSSRWRTASALSRRGALQTMRGAFDMAEDDLRAAADAWTGLGHERYAGLAVLDLAGLRLRQGRFHDVQQLIDQASEFDDPETSAKRLEVLGDLHRAGGRWEAAGDAYADAAAVNAALCRHRSRARVLGRGAEVAGALSHWQTATSRLKDATGALSLLGDLSSGAHPDGAQANLDGARGIICLVTGGEHRHKSLARARDHFTAAGRHPRGTPWHRLNAAYAHALLEEWDDAATQLERAIASAPEWLRSPVLDRDLADFRARRQVLSRAGG
jgi:tetratricopeptide (TPR) repeat protein